MSETYNLSYRYKATPPKPIKKETRKHLEIHKNIYNWALETLNNNEEWISKYEMHSKFTKKKKQKDNNFEQVHSLAAQKTINRIYRAIKGLSQLKQKGEKVGKLRYKSHFKSIEYSSQSIKLDGDEIRLGKIGWIPFNKHRKIPETATVQGAIIKQYGLNDWKIILQLEFDKPQKKKLENIDDAVGIDLNVSNFLVDSDGNKIEQLNLKQELENIQREQQKLSRKQKHSKNWKKQRLKLQQKHEKLTNKRRDILHKITRYYIDNYDLICVEDIESKKLSEVENSSQNRIVRLEHAWSEFLSMLEYKASQAGVRVEKVKPHNTTKKCSKCGNKQDKTLRERTHNCGECGLKVDRDYNASVNILARGLKLLGVGYSEVTPVETLSSGELSVSSTSSIIKAGSHSLSGSA